MVPLRSSRRTRSALVAVDSAHSWMRSGSPSSASAPVQHAVDRAGERRHRERLLEVLDGAEGGDLRRQRRRRERGHDHGGHQRIAGARAHQQVDTVEPRHADVGDERRDRRAAIEVGGCLGRVDEGVDRRGRPRPAQRRRQRAKEVLLVVDDDQVLAHRGSSASSSTRTTVPTSGADSMASRPPLCST
jgi:hypothetical protein